MKKEEILNELIKLMKEINPKSSFDYASINLNSKLKEDLNFDSLSLLLMALGIENKFKIKLLDLKFETINNVSNIVDYIYKKIN